MKSLITSRKTPKKKLSMNGAKKLGNFICDHTFSDHTCDNFFFAVIKLHVTTGDHT